MGEIDLPALLKNKRELRLRRVPERASAIRAYRVILYTMLRELREEFTASVLLELRNERALMRDRASWFSSLKSVLTSSQQKASDKMAVLLDKEATGFFGRFALSVKRSTGIDVGALFGGRPAQSVLEDYIENNASLITSLGGDTVKRLEGIIYRAKIDNKPLGDVSAEVQKAFRVSKQRADLIATDQIASLNSDLTREAAQRVGVREYIWRGRLDHRERPLHISLEGRRFKMGEYTGAESGLPPGKPVRCRCHAQLVIPPAKRVGRKALEAATMAAILAGISTATAEEETGHE